MVKYDSVQYNYDDDFIIKLVTIMLTIISNNSFFFKIVIRIKFIIELDQTLNNCFIFLNTVLLCFKVRSTVSSASAGSSDAVAASGFDNMAYEEPTSPSTTTSSSAATTTPATLPSAATTPGAQDTMHTGLFLA